MVQFLSNWLNGMPCSGESEWVVVFFRDDEGLIEELFDGRYVEVIYTMMFAIDYKRNSFDIFFDDFFWEW